METRIYFVLGDIFANVTTGIAAALATLAIVSPGWNMVVGVFVGMAVGMAIAFVLSLAVFAFFLGAMEVMIPLMLSGMAAGMWLGMAVPMGPIDAARAAGMGGVTGLGAVAFTYAVNARLRGKVG